MLSDRESQLPSGRYESQRAAHMIRMSIVYFHRSQAEPCNADLMSLCIQLKLDSNGANHENQAEQEHVRKSRCADEVIKQKSYPTISFNKCRNKYC